MKKATTLRIDRIRIARHIKPRLGRMKVTDIGRADIEQLMIDVGSGRIRGEATPHPRGGIHAASRTVGLLGGIFTFAVEREFVKTNPTRGGGTPSTGDKITSDCQHLLKVNLSLAACGLGKHGPPPIYAIDYQ